MYIYGGRPWGSAGIGCLIRGDVVRPVVRLRAAGDVDVGVSVAGCVDLVALAEVFDDVQVDPGRLHEAVLQQPSI